ncbi:uncharacterized protein ACNS7B_024005 isoform 13-T13 [Menidia menidia]
MGNICSLFFGCARYEDVDQNHAQQQEEERIIGTGSFPKNGPRMERITEMEKLYKQKEQLEGELKKKVQEAEESRHKEEELKSLQLRHHDIESHLKKSHKYEKSARLQKEAELEALRKRSAEVESSYQEELQKERSARQQKEAELKALRKSIADMETLHKEQLHEERSARQQKEELEALRKRSAEVESSYQEELQKERSARQQKEEELKALRKSIADMETLHKEQLHEERAARQQKEAELEALRKRSAEVESSYQEELQKERSARQQKEAELEALRRRLDAGLKAGCRSCEQQEREHRESMTEMDTFYKNKLQEARSAAKQKEEELKSFRERLAADVSVSLKAGDTESINDPVSKTRLVEMYDNLKLLHWPKMKEALKAATMQPQEARALIQASFEAAAQAMKKKRQLVEEAFGAAGPSGGAGPQKVREYRQITLGNLKMAVFHSSKADLLQTHLPEHGGGLPQSELLDVGALRSECFWLGCLMALNSPPLQPDWENHTPGMDPWDLFPRDIKPYSAV